MWMNAIKTMFASGASVSTRRARSCACVRLASNSALTRLTVKVRPAMKFLLTTQSNMSAFAVWPSSYSTFMLKHAQCCTVGRSLWWTSYSQLGLAYSGSVQAWLKGFTPWSQDWRVPGLHGWYPELPLPWVKFEWPHCEQGVLLPLEHLPLAPLQVLWLLW